MSDDAKPGRIQSIILVIGAFAAMIAAGVSLIAYFFSSPTDFNNMWKRWRRGYSVSITEPTPNAKIDGGKAVIGGTAILPDEWSLIVLLQTPDELKYYIVGGGAVAVREGGRWSVPDVPIGSGNQGDFHEDYKVVALLVDEKGQEQVQAAMADPKAGDAPWMANVPHNADKDIVRVHLVS